MTHFSKYTNTRKSATVFFMFVFLLMFNFSAFSQSVPNNSIVDTNVHEVKNNVKDENSRMSSNLEFVLWFMGSKQDPNTIISNRGIDAKKEIITSGLAPNRLLIKALLKKVVNYETTLS